MKTVCRIKNCVLETIKAILSSFFNYTNIYKYIQIYTNIYKYIQIYTNIYKSYLIITLNGIFVNTIKNYFHLVITSASEVIRRKKTLFTLDCFTSFQSFAMTNYFNLEILSRIYGFLFIKKFNYTGGFAS